MKTTLILCLSIIAFYFLGCTKENNPVKISDKEPINEKPSVSLINPVATTEIFDSVLVKIEATDNKGITKVEFYVNNSIAKVFYTPPYEFYWTITTIEDSLNYSIYAKAYDADDNMSSTEVIIVNVKRLIAPTKLRFTNINDASVKLEWDDNSRWESGYIVEISTDSVNYSELTRLQNNSTSYTLTQLDTSKLYYFRVRAHKDAILSKHSNGLSIKWKLIGMALEEILISRMGSATRLISWNPQTNYLCISSYANKVIIYDFLMRTTLYTFNNVMYGAMSQNGQYLVVSLNNNGIQVRSLLNGEIIKTFTNSNQRYYLISFLIDNDNVVAQRSGGGFDFWKISSGDYIKSVFINSIDKGSFSKDGQYFLGSNNYFGVYHVNSGSFSSYTNPSYSPIWSLTFSDDTKYFATGHRDSLIVVYNFDNGEVLHEFHGNHKSHVSSLSFANNKNIIASGSVKTLVLYDLLKGSMISKIDSFSGSMTALAFSPNGDKLVIDNDGSLELWKWKYEWSE